MRVITNSPIINEATSNCCGNSSFEGYSNANEMETKGSKLFSKSKSTKKGFFSTEAKETRSEKRALRKASTLTTKDGKKPKRNAKNILVKKDKTGKERFFYPLSKLFKKDGKWFKRTKDKKVVEVKSTDVVTTTKADGSVIVVDKNEVAKATGMPVDSVTPLAVEKVVTAVPQTDTDAKTAGAETGTPPTEPVVTLEVPKEKVEMTADGNVFLEADTQKTNEPTKDASDKPEMSKTQKTILWTVGIVAIGAIAYAVYRSMNKNN